MTSGSILPLDITVNVTSSLESTAVAVPQLPYDISVTVTTSSLVTIPFINVGATSSQGTTVVVSALEPYTLNVYSTASAAGIVVPSTVLPYTVAVYATESYATLVVPSPQGTPAFQIITTADTYAVTASVAYQAYTASYLLGSIQSASYAATASVLYGTVESASAAMFAISASYGTSASMAKYASAVSWSNIVNVPTGLVSGSTQINTGSFSGSITTASYAITASYAQNVPTLAWGNITAIPIGLVSASVQVNTGSFSGSITLAQTASFVATASYATTASYALSNRDIELPVCSNQPANTVIKTISSQLNEPDSTDRFQFDFSSYSQYRMTVAMVRAGPSGSKIGVQYSTDQNTWNYLDSTSGSLVSTTSTGIRTTNWLNLDVTSRSDVFIRWIVVDGDNLSDTSFRYISLGVK